MPEKLERLHDGLTLRELLMPLSGKAQPQSQSWSSIVLGANIGTGISVDARARMGLASKAGKIMAKRRRGKYES